MQDLGLLRDIVILIAVSVPLGIVFARAGLPTIVGFLLTGVIIGPSGLGFVTGAHSVEVLAEVGVVLLLFTIGLEFSATKLLRIRRAALIGGGLQVLFTTLVVMTLSITFGIDLKVAFLLGFIVSLSSTAIALKLLLDSGEISTPHGSFSVAVLLFQDIAVVLMVIVVQGFGAGSTAAEVDAFTMAKKLGTAVAAVAGIVLVASVILPRLFFQVVKLRNREVFILTIVLVCLGTALATAFFGLSLALGAFIAGIVISESEYAEQIVADVIPFKETFASLFFISIGMLLELKYLAAHAPSIVGIAVAIIIAKAVIVVAIGQILRQPLRLSILAGLGIAQIGEFSFILIKMGEGYGMLDAGLYQTLLAVSILTMAATPFVFKASPAVAFAVAGRVGRAGRAARRHEETAEHGKTAVSNHVMIIGYSLSGRHLAAVLKKTGIEHLVIDVAADKVADAKKSGHKAYFSDATHPEALKKFGVERAKIVVVGIDDPIGARRIVKTVSEMNPAATIIVKTRFLKEVEDLKRLGASQVIPEEYETSVEIFSRVLRGYGIPTNIIENQIELIRQEGYAMLRSPYLEKETLAKLTRVLEATTMDTFYIDDESTVAGKTLRALNLRRETGTTVIAIVRQGKAVTSPEADETIRSGDILVLLGGHAELHRAIEILKGASKNGALS
jgi:CPA2 family monovalent cation:H+ antiporter-2